ncbi:cytochrome b/b6 domain-containing protein [Colwellia sp. Bg11-28]|uniref:cytochrome b/b6 domain-containing protein n=1 Tax=Colwellia sp. Bg11-28 TaxID=2058305 RepID=UPI000C34CA97|nr:cytochrome b/b6 domain-containing protein [Colwellia sp. Bg11-28]PKH86934.1 cytochrome B [Colwellia sp. Bg11-28]
MSDQSAYPTYAKLIHLGIAFFGVFAFLTGESAEDGITSNGYLLHSYLGLSLASIMLIRVAMGFTKSQALSFKAWSPFSKQQRQYAIEDFRSLLTLKIPKRGPHDGLAGVTQAFGLLIFIWMSVTGTILFMLGSESKSNIFEYVEELHEVGESLIPIFLALHVGAVILHSLCGKSNWRKMFNNKLR